VGVIWAFCAAVRTGPVTAAASGVEAVAAAGVAEAVGATVAADVGVAEGDEDPESRFFTVTVN